MVCRNYNEESEEDEDSEEEEESDDEEEDEEEAEEEENEDNELGHYCKFPTCAPYLIQHGLFYVPYPFSNAAEGLVVT